MMKRKMEALESLSRRRCASDERNIAINRVTIGHTFQPVSQSLRFSSRAHNPRTGPLVIYPRNERGQINKRV